MGLLFWIGIFLLSMTALIKAADYFTDSSERVGLFFGLSPFVIGVTIVAVGTSVPELATGLIAVLGGGMTEFVTANVIGSNIANMLLVVGASVVIGGSIAIKKNLLGAEIPFLATATSLFIFFIIWDGTLAMYEALILLLAFGIYIWYVLTKRRPKKETIDMSEVKKEKLSKKDIFILLGSVAVIYLASKYTVDSILNISKELGLNFSALVAFVVALGTSLPELVVSIVAVRKKQFEVAIGNIFGSNVFNLLVVVGIPALFTSLTISREMMIIGIPFLGLATILFMLAVMDNRIKRYEGAMFLVIYLSFIVTLFVVKL